MSHFAFMFTTQEFEEMAKQLAEKFGRKHAIRLLVIEGVAPTTAGRVIRGTYGQPIGQFVGRVLKDVLEKQVLNK